MSGSTTGLGSRAPAPRRRFEAGTSAKRDRAVLAVVLVTAFLTMLDNTVVTTAAPSIAADLRVDLPTLEWVATGYMVAYAGLLLAGGRLADRYGWPRTLRAGLLVFTIASLACGLPALPGAPAGSAATLIAARVVQGLGAALLVPATLAAIAAGDERFRLRGAAGWTASGAVALAAGPVLGGVLSQHAHWSWIFLINVPVGLAALVVVRSTTTAQPVPAQGAHVRLDLPGVATATVALLAFAYALSHGTGHGWRDSSVLVSALIAVAAGVACLLWERVARDPVIDPRLFAVRAFSGGVAVQVLWGLGVNGVFFYTAIYLQQVGGYSPALAGLAFVAVAVAVAVVAPFTPALVRRYGPARVVAAGLALVAVGMVAVALAGTGPVLLVGALAVIGFGSALTVPLGAVVLAAAPARQAGVAGGMFAVAREASGVLGIAGIGVVVAGGNLARGYPIGLVLAATLVLLGAVLGARLLPGTEHASR